MSITATSITCPPLDGTSRSIWSILGSCALTLLICVWHAIHPKIPSPCRKKWHHAFEITMKEAFISLLNFLVPEFMVYFVSNEWWRAQQMTDILRPHFKELNLKWTVTHTFFAQMGGFYYCNEGGTAKLMDSIGFLRHCQDGLIANPVITAEEIQDKSKSDALGKAILAVQLVWFALQVAVRHFSGLAVTLVELDTVCMAVLTMILLVFWRHKPYRTHCVHIFYAPKYLEKGLPLNAKGVKFEPPDVINGYPRYWHEPADDDPLIGQAKEAMEEINFGIFYLCVTWFIFGGLHLLAWNYPFLTVAEKWLWRSSSLLLTAPPLVIVVFRLLAWISCSFGFRTASSEYHTIGRTHPMISFLTKIKWEFSLGLVCRILLIAVMFASLRSVPCTSHIVVPWTTYIPHL